MYPNRDEILKGLNDLISTIHKILQAKDQEEAQMQAVAQHNKTATGASAATGDASSALAADDAAQSAATQSPASAKPLTAAEILFANFPDDEEQDDQERSRRKLDEEQCQLPDALRLAVVPESSRHRDAGIERTGKQTRQQ